MTERILRRISDREFVKEVPALSLRVGVALRHLPTLTLVVVRPVFLPRELLLLAFKPLAFVGKVEFDAEGSVPFAGRLLLERDLLEIRVVLRNRRFLMGCTRAVVLRERY